MPPYTPSRGPRRGASRPVIAPQQRPRPQEWTAPLASTSRSGTDARELERLEDLVLGGGRVTAEEALFLHDKADLATLGRMADAVRRKKHPEGRVTYIVDRNVNPTNVCITDCGFCAFYRRPGHEEAYVLSRDEIREIFMQVSIYAGIPAGVDSFRIAREVFAELDNKA